MPYTQKYCLVSFIEPLQITSQFDMSNWPLHITLADVFAIDRLNTHINAQLRELLRKQKIVETAAQSEAMLGSVRVVLLEKNEELVSLHNSLITLLESNFAKFNTPAFTGDGFLPHCTIQKAGRLHEGDIVRIREITLVDMFPDSNWQQRKVLDIFKLGS